MQRRANTAREGRVAESLQWIPCENLGRIQKKKRRKHGRISKNNNNNKVCQCIHFEDWKNSKNKKKTQPSVGLSENFLKAPAGPWPYLSKTVYGLVVYLIPRNLYQTPETADIHNIIYLYYIFIFFRAIPLKPS